MKIEFLILFIKVNYEGMKENLMGMKSYASKLKTILLMNYKHISPLKNYLKEMKKIAIFYL